MKTIPILAFVIIIILSVIGCRPIVTQEEAEKTANDFVDNVVSSGQSASVDSTYKHGPWWESKVTVNGKRVVLFIDENDGECKGIECPDQHYMTIESFEDKGGDGSGCWK